MSDPKIKPRRGAAPKDEPQELTLSAGPLSLSLKVVLPPSASLFSAQEEHINLQITGSHLVTDHLEANGPLSATHLQDHLERLGALDLPSSHTTVTLTLSEGVRLTSLIGTCSDLSSTCELLLSCPEEEEALGRLEHLELCERTFAHEVFFSYATRMLICAPEHIVGIANASFDPSRPHAVLFPWISDEINLSRSRLGVTLSELMHMRSLQRNHPAPPPSEEPDRANNLQDGVIHKLYTELKAQKALPVEPSLELFARAQRRRCTLLLRFINEPLHPHRHRWDPFEEEEGQTPLTLSEELYAVAGISVETLFRYTRAPLPELNHLTYLAHAHLCAIALSPSATRPLHTHTGSLEGLINTPRSQTGGEALLAVTSNTAALRMWADRPHWPLSMWMPIQDLLLEHFDLSAGGRQSGRLGPLIPVNLHRRALITQLCTAQGIASSFERPPERISCLSFGHNMDLCSLIHSYTLSLLERPAPILKRERQERLTRQDQGWAQQGGASALRVLRDKTRGARGASDSAPHSHLNARLARLLAPRPVPEPLFELGKSVEAWIQALLSHTTAAALTRALIALCHVGLAARDQSALYPAFSLLRLITQGQGTPPEAVRAVSDSQAPADIEARIDAWMNPAHLHRVARLSLSAPTDDEGGAELLLERPLDLKGDTQELPELLAWLCALREETNERALRVLHMALSHSFKKPSKKRTAG